MFSADVWVLDRLTCIFLDISVLSSFYLGPALFWAGPLSCRAPVLSERTYAAENNTGDLVASPLTGSSPIQRAV